MSAASSSDKKKQLKNPTTDEIKTTMSIDDWCGAWEDAGLFSPDESMEFYNALPRKGIEHVSDLLLLSEDDVKEITKKYSIGRRNRFLSALAKTKDVLNSSSQPPAKEKRTLPRPNLRKMMVDGVMVVAK
jgi:hypothetical protein